jgi:hypothetical protein
MSLSERELERSSFFFGASLSLSSAHFLAMSGELELSSRFGELVSTLVRCQSYRI